MFTLRKWANPRVEAYTCYLKCAVDSDNPKGSVNTNVRGWDSTLTLRCLTDIALRSPFFPAENRHISYMSLYCSNSSLQVVLDCCSQRVKCFCVCDYTAYQRLFQNQCFAGNVDLCPHDREVRHPRCVE